MPRPEPHTRAPILRILNPQLYPIKKIRRNTAQHPRSELPFMGFYIGNVGAAFGAGVAGDLRGGAVGFQVGEVWGRDGGGHDGKGGEELAGGMAAGVAVADAGF